MNDTNTVLLAATNETATFTTSAFDMKTGTNRGGIKAKCEIGAVTGTTPTLVLVYQCSSDSSTWTVQANAEGGTITTAGEYFAAIDTNLRYIRAVGTITGTLPVFPTTIFLTTARP